MQIKSENEANYNVDTDQEIINQALKILSNRLRKPGQAIASPEDVKNYLSLQLAEKQSEVFCTLFLDTRHRVIEFKEMFHGTINGASVYPREVVKEALNLNASAVIFAHNHPSGEIHPVTPIDKSRNNYARH